MKLWKGRESYSNNNSYMHNTKYKSTKYKSIGVICIINSKYKSFGDLYQQDKIQVVWREYQQHKIQGI